MENLVIIELNLSIDIVDKYRVLSTYGSLIYHVSILIDMLRPEINFIHEWPLKALFVQDFLKAVS